MTARTEDVNGFITIAKNPISRVGVFPYLGRSIGAPDPDKIYNVFRPAEVLAEAAENGSFKLIPIVDEHDMLGDSDEGLMPAERKGVHGTTGEAVYFDGDVLYADLKIFSESMADSIEAGKRDLSLGYRCTYAQERGEYNGQPYEYVQREMRGNHLALVDEARCNVSVLDHKITYDSLDLGKEDKMAKQKLAKPMFAKDDSELSSKLATLSRIAERLDLTDDERSDIVNSIAWVQEKLSGALVVQEAEKIVDDAPTEEVVVVADEDEDKNAEDETKFGLGERDENADAPALKEALDTIGKLSKRLARLEGKDSFKDVMAEVSKRDKLASELSHHIGTFDCSEMSLSEVAKYAAKKLSLACDSGEELATVRGFLSAKKPSVPAAGFDAVDEGSIIDQYINGSK